RRASSGTPALASSDRTACTCTGSALCEAHITATSRSVKSNGASDSDTVAWTGFIEERANSSLSGSPALATTRPSRSTTATSPAWTDSSSPERITRRTGTAGMPSRETTRSGTRPGFRHQRAEEIRRVAPKNLGAGEALQRVADLGSRLGIASIVTALWPATAYGSGLERAFDRLGPTADRRLEGLRGRGLFFLVLLPTFVLGSLAGSFLGTVALGRTGVAKIVGYALAFFTGFLAASAAVVLIYRIFPPKRLAWTDVLRATAVAATGISVL